VNIGAESRVKLKVRDEAFITTLMWVFVKSAVASIKSPETSHVNGTAEDLAVRGDSLEDPEDFFGVNSTVLPMLLDVTTERFA
jgi:hypothetical protein